ncbi:MAG: hypothetical protein FJ102_13290, partial [Deltaproteobacteria bacterium]|nr:hypothetical protein [Deltaproteobacteria bacterium]
MFLIIVSITRVSSAAALAGAASGSAAFAVLDDVEVDLVLVLGVLVDADFVDVLAEGVLVVVLDVFGWMRSGELDGAGVLVDLVDVVVDVDLVGAGVATAGAGGGAATTGAGAGVAITGA